MNIVLWIVQALFAALFLFWGIIDLTKPKIWIADHAPWVEDYTLGQVRLIGFLFVLGGLGLILPSLTSILPWLTPLAAIGLALLMIGAMFVQFRRKDKGVMILIIISLVAALFVAYGRWFL